MSEHIALLHWELSGDFAGKTYLRDHQIVFKDSHVLHASSAAAFSGNPTLVDPEEIFTASLSSCHMLTFLAIAAIRGFVVKSYRDRAVGVLGKGAKGKLCMTHVTLYPQLEFSGKQPTSEELKKLHERAHDECFIANSVSTEITVVSG